MRDECLESIRASMSEKELELTRQLVSLAGCNNKDGGVEDDASVAESSLTHYHLPSVCPDQAER